MAVVKADAYGHGAVTVSQALVAEGVDYLGVAHCWEARQLSEAGITAPIYILGPTFPAEREEIVRNHWTPCISDEEGMSAFAKLAEQHSPDKPLKVHLAVDTGMGRGGVLPEHAVDLARKIQDLPSLQLEGIGSHLPSADEDRDFTNSQMATFAKLLDDIAHACGHLRYLHISNSAGLLDYTAPGCNLSRPGLMLYGLSPIEKFQQHLTPVMSLRSRISIIRMLPKGHGVSYGRSAVLERDTAVATVGIGYGDGYPRALSGKGAEVFIAGTRCPLLGRVTMDQIMIDVTDHPRLPTLESGTEVELFGKNILVTEIAQKANTIAWDVLTGIMPRVERVYR